MQSVYAFFPIHLIYMNSQTKGDAVYMSFPFIIKKKVTVQQTADDSGNAFLEID